MKRIAFVGTVGAGKTTLFNALQGNYTLARKTQAVEFNDNGDIDTPGEYFSHPRWYHALITTLQDVDMLIYVHGANDPESRLPAGLLDIGVSKRQIAVISKTDMPDADVAATRKLLLETGFEEPIFGHKPGETFDVNVTFPDGYSDSTDASGNTVKLSGQKAVFTVTLNYISESVLPELTDAWVASNFGSSNNLYTAEALRAYYQEQLYTSNLNTAVMDDLMANSTFKSIPQQVMDYQVNQCLNYYSTLAGYYGYDLDGLVQNLLGYESTDDMLAHLESSLENYSKEALLYQAVAESLDITPTQEQLDAYSDYKDTYGSNYCTMVALMDAVTDTLTSGAVVS